MRTFGFPIPLSEWGLSEAYLKHVPGAASPVPPAEEAPGPLEEGPLDGGDRTWEEPVGEEE